MNDEIKRAKKLRSDGVTRRAALELMGKTSLVGLLASACRLEPPPPPLVDPKRPNIIYMHSHDTGRYVEPYGYNISTPHLQKFADEGMVFRQAFSASPTCSPSRASLLTGMTPGCNGMWGLAHKGGKLNDYSQSLVQTLKRVGYTTALAGVQHIAAGKPKDCADIIGYDNLIKIKGGRGNRIADAAVDYLERPPAKPFFLDVGFGETHLLPNGESRFGYGYGDTNTAEIPTSLRDTPETRRDMADYAVAASALDEHMGRILKTLERNGLAENTLVICTTDHGIPMPGMKSHHTDGGLGVMLMMRGPRGFSGGKVSNALVSQIDIFPTLCELLELIPPSWLQGTSLMPLVRGETDEVNEAVFAEYESHAVPEPQASVRTKRYKYIRRLDGSTNVRPRNTDDTFTKELWLWEGWGTRPVATEQLYDLFHDAEEQRNLVAEPNYQDALREMRGRMVARMDAYDNSLLQKYDVASAPPQKRQQAMQPYNYHVGDDASEIGVIYTE